MSSPPPLATLDGEYEIAGVEPSSVVRVAAVACFLVGDLISLCLAVAMHFTSSGLDRELLDGLTVLVVLCPLGLPFYAIVCGSAAVSCLNWRARRGDRIRFIAEPVGQRVRVARIDAPSLARAALWCGNLLGLPSYALFVFQLGRRVSENDLAGAAVFLGAMALGAGIVAAICYIGALIWGIQYNSVAKFAGGVVGEFRRGDGQHELSRIAPLPTALTLFLATLALMALSLLGTLALMLVKPGKDTSDRVGWQMAIHVAWALSPLLVAWCYNSTARRLGGLVMEIVPAAR